MCTERLTTPYIKNI